MLRKIPNICLKTILWTATAGFLVVCLVLLRLILSPIDLEFARDTIQNTASNALEEWTLDYRRASIGWNWRHVRPWVRIDDIVIYRQDRAIRAEIPTVGLEVTFATLLGDPDIVTAQISGVTAHLSADAFAASGPQSAPSSPATGPLSDLQSVSIGELEPEDFKPLADEFQRVAQTIGTVLPSLQSATIGDVRAYIRAAAGSAQTEERAVHLPSVDLLRADTVTSLHVQIDLPLDDHPAALDLLSAIDTETGETHIQAGLSHLMPASLQKQFGAADFLNWLHFPIDVTADLRLASTTGLQSAEFDVSLLSGELYDESAYPDPMPVESGRVAARLSPDGTSLTLHRISVVLPDVEVSGTGSIRWDQQGALPSGSLRLALAEAQVRTVLDYWPIARDEDGRAKGGRAWVDRHMINASAGNALFKIDWDTDGAGPYYEGSPFELTFDFWETK